MVAEFPIADELLAEALDWPSDRRSVEQVLNRPDPFENMWDELRRMDGGNHN